MNLFAQGAHAAADWIGLKVRSYRKPVAVYASPSGQLVAVAAPTAKARAGFRLVGTYCRGLQYRDAVADMACVVDELQQARAA